MQPLSLPTLLLALLLAAFSSHAAPRAPWPPTPEVAPLYYEGFDEPYFPGETDSEVIVQGVGNFEESWSGYALQRGGADVVPFVISALSGDGTTNISSDTAAGLRCWVHPYWSSGAGPGATAPFLAFYAVAGGQSLLCWSLQVSPDGSSLSLVPRDDECPDRSHQQHGGHCCRWLVRDGPAQERNRRDMGRH